HQGEIYMQAASLSPGNRRAWMELSALAEQLRLDAKQTAALRAAVTKFALHAYPDFAFEVLQRSISGRGTTQQINAMNEMRGLFANRPDLQAQIGLALGDLYSKDNRPNDALAAYGEVLGRNTSVAPIVMETMQRVDDMLRKSQRLPDLAGAYALVWQ